MTKNKEKIIRGRLRAALGNGSEVNVLRVLSNLRSQSSSDYRLGSQTFKRVAPIAAKKLLCLGPSEFKKLIFTHTLPPISLKDELVWASAWLCGQSTKINHYRSFANKLQELVLAGEMDIAAAQLDVFCATKGWSLWAVELRLALEEQAKGTDAQKLLAAKWRATAPNTIASVIVQIVSDRNNATFPWDAFYLRCMDSFQRFTMAQWVPVYLMYRALSSSHDPETSFPFILSRELTSSLLDYYEAVVETLIAISDDKLELTHLRPDAIRTVDSLIKDGYSDHRLQKIRFILSGIVVPNSSDVFEHARTPSRLISDACSVRLQQEELPLSLPQIPRELLEDIRKIQEEGFRAQESIVRLIKFGVNLKGLDIGIIVALATQYLTSHLTELPPKNRLPMVT